MNKLKIMMIALASCLCMQAENTISVIDHASFYDGYLVGNIPDDAPDEGYLRLYTYLNSVRLSDEQLDQIGEHLTIDVTVYAVCDNYDRIGSVNLAFIPKGQDTYSVNYNDDDPLRIEVARFITPFMNKNKSPESVPYLFVVDNLSKVLRSQQIREQYDIWLELEVFGVPYAAQQQVKGCEGCNHVFDGSVNLVTDDTPAQPDATAVFVPVVTRRSDWRGDRGINNYNASCTDEVGRTIKTYKFNLPVDVKNGRVVIMMSNHGAGTNGEEYERRMHYASFDGDAALEWKPGRTTCEPYRQYNTQSNGIYGWRPRTDASWQSFSNWCPGAPIPYQTFSTGAMQAGEHSVTIEVPDAVFYGNDGYFPVSIYFQGDTDSDDEIFAPVDFDSIPASIVDVYDDYTSSTVVEDGVLNVKCSKGLERIEVYNRDGALVALAECQAGTTNAAVAVDALPHGVYVVVATTGERVEARKIAL